VADKNPVAYAEGHLGVHTLWNHAQERFEKYEAALLRRASLHTELRKIRDVQTDAEMQIMQDGKAKYAEISATAFEKIYKTLVHENQDHQKLRMEERERQCDLDLVEAEISAHEYQLKLMNSRLIELGGLLNFYAAAKRV